MNRANDYFSQQAKDVEAGVSLLWANACKAFWDGEIYSHDPAEVALYDLADGLAKKGLAAKLGWLLLEAAEEVYGQAT